MALGVGWDREDTREDVVAGVRGPGRMEAISGDGMLEVRDGREEKELENREEEVENRAEDDSVGEAREVGRNGEGEKEWYGERGESRDEKVDEIKAEDEVEPLAAMGEDRENDNAADEAAGGESGEAETADNTADVGEGADSGTAEEVAVVAAVVVVAADCDEPAVLVDDSPLVDAMDINMAAADTVLSLMGMTVAAALLSEVSLNALTGTVARVGELGEPVEAVSDTLAGVGRPTGSFTEDGGGALAEVVGEAGDEVLLGLMLGAIALDASCAGWLVAGGKSEGGRSEVGGRPLNIDTGSAALAISSTRQLRTDG